MRGQPEEVLVDHRGVDHQEEVGFAGAVGDEVVDHAAVFVEHQRVLALAGGELGDVVGEHPVEPGRRRRAADEELAHVGNVENPAALVRTAVCSSMIEVYWTGMFQPAKGTRRAPSARWAASSGECLISEITPRRVEARPALVNPA